MNNFFILLLGGISLLAVLLLDAYGFKEHAQELLKFHIAFFGGVALMAVF